MMRWLFLVFAVSALAEAACYKTIDRIGYNEPLELNQNIIRVVCDGTADKINLENKYAKYVLKKGEFITKNKVVEIVPKRVVFKVSDSISLSTTGELVAEYSGYVKVKKPNKEIKKYRIK